MAVLKKDTLLVLALMFSSAEATNFSDPIICYVLDAVLLFYCIIFTALYFKLKVLVGQSNDDYQEIQKKSEPRKKKRKAKEPKSKRNAAEAIEMKPTPPVPTRD
ncbi:CD247 antigen like precursor [Silurus meridionalis]|nr:CD247 antigen like precursor [Silurus meridionalis]